MTEQEEDLFCLSRLTFDGMQLTCELHDSHWGVEPHRDGEHTWEAK